MVAVEKKMMVLDPPKSVVASRRNCSPFANTKQEAPRVETDSKVEAKPCRHMFPEEGHVGEISVKRSVNKVPCLHFKHAVFDVCSIKTEGVKSAFRTVHVLCPAEVVCSDWEEDARE